MNGGTPEPGARRETFISQLSPNEISRSYSRFYHSVYFCVLWIHESMTFSKNCVIILMCRKYIGVLECDFIRKKCSIFP